MPFKDPQESLEVINAVSEGIVPPYLESFLSNIPKGTKLAVVDTKLGGTIQETLNVRKLFFFNN